MANNHDIFSFFLLGCDFKVNLKEEKKTLCAGVVGTHEHEFNKIIQKDIVSLRELRSTFSRKNVTGVLYEDFLTSEYSSHKYKRNLPFIVRNSHMLKIHRDDGLGNGHTPSSIVFLRINLRMNCSPVCLSNVCGPGLHRKLWGGFLQVRDAH